MVKEKRKRKVVIPQGVVDPDETTVIPIPVKLFKHKSVIVGRKCDDDLVLVNCDDVERLTESSTAKTSSSGCTRRTSTTKAAKVPGLEDVEKREKDAILNQLDQYQKARRKFLTNASSVTTKSMATSATSSSICPAFQKLGSLCQKASTSAVKSSSSVTKSDATLQSGIPLKCLLHALSESTSKNISTNTKERPISCAEAMSSTSGYNLEETEKKERETILRQLEEYQAARRKFLSDAANVAVCPMGTQTPKTTTSVAKSCPAATSSTSSKNIPEIPCIDFSAAFPCPAYQSPKTCKHASSRSRSSSRGRSSKRKRRRESPPESSSSSESDIGNQDLADKDPADSPLNKAFSLSSKKPPCSNRSSRVTIDEYYVSDKSKRKSKQTELEDLQKKFEEARRKLSSAVAMIAKSVSSTSNVCPALAAVSSASKREPRISKEDLICPAVERLKKKYSNIDTDTILPCPYKTRSIHNTSSSARRGGTKLSPRTSECPSIKAMKKREQNLKDSLVKLSMSIPSLGATKLSDDDHETIPICPSMTERKSSFKSFKPSKTSSKSSVKIVEKDGVSKTSSVKIVKISSGEKLPRNASACTQCPSIKSLLQAEEEKDSTTKQATKTKINITVRTDDGKTAKGSGSNTSIASGANDSQAKAADEKVIIVKEPNSKLKISMTNDPSISASYSVTKKEDSEDKD